MFHDRGSAVHQRHCSSFGATLSRHFTGRGPETHQNVRRSLTATSQEDPSTSKGEWHYVHSRDRQMQGTSRKQMQVVMDKDGEVPLGDAKFNKWLDEYDAVEEV